MIAAIYARKSTDQNRPVIVRMLEDRRVIGMCR